MQESLGHISIHKLDSNDTTDMLIREYLFRAELLNDAPSQQQEENCEALCRYN